MYQEEQASRRVVARLMRTSVGVAALLAGILAAETARAQAAAAPAASGATDTVQEVVVTGSRIVRSTFTTPNPVTVIN